MLKEFFNGWLNKLVANFYEFAKFLGAKVEMRFIEDSIMFEIDTSDLGGNAKYTLWIVPGNKAAIEVSWGSMTYYDSWEITPIDKNTLKIEYRGTVDPDRTLPEFVDLEGWKVEWDDE